MIAALLASVCTANWRAIAVRLGVAAGAVVALWTWHLHDRARAVSVATGALVSAYELEAAETELQAANARAAATDEANRALRRNLQAAEDEARKFAEEMEEYTREVVPTPDCTVPDDLLRRLRAN